MNGGTMKKKEYRYVLTETVISDRFFQASSDKEAKEIINRIKSDGTLDLEVHDSDVVDETLYYCPSSGEGHSEVDL